MDESLYDGLSYWNFTMEYNRSTMTRKYIVESVARNGSHPGNEEASSHNLTSLLPSHSARTFSRHRISGAINRLFLIVSLRGVHGRPFLNKQIITEYSAGKFSEAIEMFWHETSPLSECTTQQSQINEMTLICIFVVYLHQIRWIERFFSDERRQRHHIRASDFIYNTYSCRYSSLMEIWNSVTFKLMYIENSLKIRVYFYTTNVHLIKHRWNAPTESLEIQMILHKSTSSDLVHLH